MGGGAGRRSLGKHCSIAGGLSCALDRAAEHGCTAMQFFSRNPRGWAARPLSGEEADLFRETRARHAIASVAIHTNYLVNLAATDPLVRERSIAAFRDELDRAARLGADYLVVHPGSARGGTVAAGVAACVDAVRRSADGLALEGLTVLIENTAGQGDCIGRSFEQVAEIVAGCEPDVPTGVCLDTAHTFAAGYELISEGGFRRTMRAIDATFGPERVRLIHFNDSKAAFGSNVDRHWHIGEGAIGLGGLGRVARCRALSRAALVLETPVDADHDEAWNFARLEELAYGLPHGSRAPAAPPPAP
jgi:deoxyribonuclease-4